MKLKLCLIAMLAVAFSAKAQLRLGFQATILQLPQSAGNYPMSIGPGIDVGWTKPESKIESFFKGNYMLPTSTSTGGLATSATGNGVTFAVFTQKTSIMSVAFGSRYFFLDRENNFNFYASASADFVFIHTDGGTWSHLPGGYTPPFNAGDGSSHTQAMIHLGIGTEFLVGESGSLFAEVGYRIPSVQGEYNSRYGYIGEEVQIPGHPVFSLGYKFTLGGGGW